MKMITLTLSAAKGLDALPREVRERVEAGLYRYAMTGEGDVKTLQDRNSWKNVDTAALPRAMMDIGRWLHDDACCRAG